VPEADAPASDLLLLDRHGVCDADACGVDPVGPAAAWVTLADVSPAGAAGVVLSEDRRFYEHSGIDWNASRRAPGPMPGTAAPAARRP
jgi:penicillin-binding protein 1C